MSQSSRLRSTTAPRYGDAGGTGCAARRTAQVRDGSKGEPSLPWMRAVLRPASLLQATTTFLSWTMALSARNFGAFWMLGMTCHGGYSTTRAPHPWWGRPTRWRPRENCSLLLYVFPVLPLSSFTACSCSLPQHMQGKGISMGRSLHLAQPCQLFCSPATKGATGSSLSPCFVGRLTNGALFVSLFRVPCLSHQMGSGPHRSTCRASQPLWIRQELKCGSCMGLIRPAAAPVRRPWRSPRKTCAPLKPLSSIKHLECFRRTVVVPVCRPACTTP